MAVSWGSAGRVRSFLPTLLALQEAGEIRSVAGFRCYILAYVDRRLIRDHNDIDDPRVIEFIEQLILVSTQAPQQVERAASVRSPRCSAGSLR